MPKFFPYCSFTAGTLTMPTLVSGERASSGADGVLAPGLIPSTCCLSFWFRQFSASGDPLGALAHGFGEAPPEDGPVPLPGAGRTVLGGGNTVTGGSSVGGGACAAAASTKASHIAPVANALQIGFIRISSPVLTTSKHQLPDIFTTRNVQPVNPGACAW
jgi:hypothetical protein